MKRILALFFLSLVGVAPLALVAAPVTASNARASITATPNVAAKTISYEWSYSGTWDGTTTGNLRGRVYILRQLVSSGAYTDVSPSPSVVAIYTTSSGSGSRVDTASQGVGDPTYKFFIRVELINSATGSTFSGYTEVPQTAGPTPQTISVTPTSITIDKGADANFVVTGGNTSLVFNREGAFPRLGAGAGAWGMKFDTIGIYSLDIYAEADATYAKSNTVSIAVTVKGYSIKVKLPANPTAFIVNYEISQGGTYLFTTVQLAGAAEETRTFQVPASTPVTVTPVVMGLTKEGVLWTDTPGGSTTLTPSIVTPQITITGTEDLTSSGVPTPSVPSKADVDDAAKSVWKPTNSSAPAATDETLKAATDKITSSVDKLNTTLKAGIQVTVTNTGSTGGSGSDEGTHTRLDTANAHLDKIEKALDPGDAPKTTLDQANAQASSRQTWAAAGGKSVTGSPTATGISAAPGVIATQHVGDRDVTLSWDGVGSTWAQGHSVLVAARPVLLWAMVLVTIFLLGKDVQSYAIALPTVSQADAAVGIENAIPGVSQGKTWGAAALITVAIMACGVALVAVVDAVANAYGYGITTLFTALNLSVFGAVLGIVDRYVPIVAMCQLAIFRWGAPYILTPIYLAASSLIKFLKA